MLVTLKQFFLAYPPFFQSSGWIFHSSQRRFPMLHLRMILSSFCWDRYTRDINYSLSVAFFLVVSTSLSFPSVSIIVLSLLPDVNLILAMIILLFFFSNDVCYRSVSVFHLFPSLCDLPFHLIPLLYYLVFWVFILLNPYAVLLKCRTLAENLSYLGSGLQDSETTCFCCLKSPGWWHFVIAALAD